MSDEIPVEPLDIHTFFGLTYANYLTLPRTFLQSMPIEWQHRFTACLTELDEAFGGFPQAEAYYVQAGEEHEVGSLSDADLKRVLGGVVERLPIDPDDDPDEVMETFAVDGEEVEAWHRVLLPVVDPVPHYNRGRTHIEPGYRP